MQATDILDLYRYEDAIETAVKTLLTDNGITAYRQRDADERVAPFAAVQFTTGAGVEHYKIFADKSRRPQVFAGSLAIGVVTDRLNGVQDPSHSTIRAKVRNLIYGFLDTLNPLLDHHAILKVLEAGTSPTITGERNEDSSIVNFTLDFCIRTDAWPNP